MADGREGFLAPTVRKKVAFPHGLPTSIAMACNTHPKVELPFPREGGTLAETVTMTV